MVYVSRVYFSKFYEAMYTIRTIATKEMKDICIQYTYKNAT
jgi:hypothetical protein